jgi:hypothetical protein
VTDSENHARWRKSSFSDTTNCLEVRVQADGTVAVRNSNDVDGGQLVLTRDQLGAWLAGCKKGEFDDLI